MYEPLGVSTSFYACYAFNHKTGASVTDRILVNPVTIIQHLLDKSDHLKYITNPYCLLLDQIFSPPHTKETLAATEVLQCIYAYTYTASACIKTRVA